VTVSPANKINQSSITSEKQQKPLKIIQNLNNDSNKDNNTVSDIISVFPSEVDALKV